MKRGSFGVLGLLALTSLGCSSESDSDPAAGAAAATTLEVPDDIAPADWNVHTPADAPTPGTEPINVIITTDLGIDYVMAALGAPFGAVHADWWKKVELGTGVPTTEKELKQLAETKSVACISAELANIDGDGLREQDLSMRVAGCFPGVLLEGESHIRLWESAKRRQKVAKDRTVSTWYIAASQEHLCEVKIGDATKKWHCILPKGYTSKNAYKNSGYTIGAPSGGYDKGRDDFVDDLKTVAKLRPDMAVTCTNIPSQKSGRDDGLRVIGKDGHELPRVPFDGEATYCTVMNRNPPAR